MLPITAIKKRGFEQKRTDNTVGSTCFRYLFNRFYLPNVIRIFLNGPVAREKA
jgi:hypothetical protein